MLSAESRWSLQNRVEVCRIALKSTESCQNLGRIVYAILARILVILAESRFSEGAQNRMILAESQKRNNPESCLRDQTSDPGGNIWVSAADGKKNKPKPSKTSKTLIVLVQGHRVLMFLMKKLDLPLSEPSKLRTTIFLTPWFVLSEQSRISILRFYLRFSSKFRDMVILPENDDNYDVFSGSNHQKTRILKFELVFFSVHNKHSTQWFICSHLFHNCELTDIQRFTEQYATLFSAKLNKIKSNVFLKICQNIGIIAQLKLCGLIGVDSGDTSYTKYTINTTKGLHLFFENHL